MADAGALVTAEPRTVLAASVASIPRIHRVLDVALAGPALLLSGPVLLCLALIVKLTSPGPAFFRQTRVGRGGRTFLLYKLRSMVVDAERLGPWYTDAEDARVTPIGALLRRTSLDELPQLWNVLRGDMSLVGPRPYVEAQRANYAVEDWTLRHRVRPGVTGLAQVSGRSDLTPEQTLAYDLEWAARPSVQGYVRILIRTAGVVVRHRGTN